MLHKSIQKTVDSYPNLSAQERQQLFKDERVIERFTTSVKEAFSINSKTKAKWTTQNFYPK